MGHPEKVTDFAYRSEHEMTVSAKAIVNAFYGSAPKFSYWNGCSAGGRQAMKEAQMFPNDFDGIIAGSPGLDWSGRTAQAVRIAQALQKEEARFTPAKAQVLHTAVVNACDGLDGLKDGLIENPAACKFDPAVLVCKGGEEPARLTQAQVDTAKLIYSPIVDAKTKREIPVWRRAASWNGPTWDGRRRRAPPGLDHFRFLVFADPTWEVQKFNIATDVARLTENGNIAAIDARDTNLKPFFDRGGKLIRYHGWSDPQIILRRAPRTASRVAANGVRSKGLAYRLFMAPGMGHCGGGEGPNTWSGGRARAVGRERESAGHDSRFAHERREGRSHASAVPVPAGRELQGQRQHRRRQQLRL